MTATATRSPPFAARRTRRTLLAPLLAIALCALGCGARTGLQVLDIADAAPDAVDVVDAPAPDTRPDVVDAPPPFDAPPPDTAPPCTPGGAPIFGGLVSIDEITEHTVHLHWRAAIDATLPPSAIIYAIFASRAPTLDDTFPVATTAPGALERVVTGLKSNTQYIFAVHALGCAGDKDTNRVERAATTLVSFTEDIEPTLNRTCALPSCHSGGSPARMLNLDHGLAYGSLIAGKFVVAGDPAASILYRSVLGLIPGREPMPPSGLPRLSAEYVAILKLWIEQGTRP